MMTPGRSNRQIRLARGPPSRPMMLVAILLHCSSAAPTPSSPRRRPPDGFLGLTTLTTSKVGCHCGFVKRSTSRV